MGIPLRTLAAAWICAACHTSVAAGVGRSRTSHRDGAHSRQSRHRRPALPTFSNAVASRSWALRCNWSILRRALAPAVVLWAVAVTPSMATHQRGTVYLQVNLSGVGTVTGAGISCPTVCTRSYTLGEVCTAEDGGGNHNGGLRQCDTVYPSVTLEATPEAGWRFVSWSGACSGGASCSPVVRSGVAAAPTTVSAAFADAAPPSVAIASPLAGPVRGTISFTATASDNVGVSEVDLLMADASLLVDTAAPYSVEVDTTTRPDGAVTLTAKATDVNGLTNSASQTITIDNTKPTVVLGSGPAGAGPAVDTFGPGTGQTFTFMATDASSEVAAVECRIAPAAFGACSGGGASHTVTDLPGGTHAFEVRARDGAGNISDVAARSFTIDATPPTATVTAGPAEGAVLPGSAVEYQFAAGEPSTFVCRVYPSGLTAPAFGECSGSDKHAATGFVAGTYSFEVRPTDAVGNVGAATRRTFVVAGTQTDRDNDGVLDVIDCNDDDPSIHQGAKDVPRNGIDEDCDNVDAAFPRLISAILFSYRALKRHTLFTELFIQPAVAGSTVRITCSGRGCPKNRSTKIDRASRRLNLSRLVRRAKLRPGARLEIRVTKPGTVGIVRRFTIRANKRRPTTTILCIAPNATKPSACPD